MNVLTYFARTTMRMEKSLLYRKQFLGQNKRMMNVHARDKRTSIFCSNNNGYGKMTFITMATGFWQHQFGQFVTASRILKQL
jgi:hypothetical protein